MIRKAVMVCTMALVTLTGGAQAQEKIEGTYVFPQKVMLSHDAAPVDGEARLTITVRGDSALATWRIDAPGKEPGKGTELRGTVKGNTVTLVSGTSQAKLRGADGEERSIDVHQEYIITIAGDAVTGTINAYTTDESVRMPPRELKGKRAAL